MHGMKRLTVWLGMVLGILGLAACGASSASMDSSGNSNSSPTGTFLEPIPGDGLHPGGYVALDEACELTDASDYLSRFETPMFRSVAVQDDIAWMVDGSLLWAVDVGDTWWPERRSLTRLEGHPLQVDLTEAGYLLVAAGEAGVHVVDVQDATAPTVVQTLALDDDALDVKVFGSLAAVAVGDSGVRLIKVDPTGSATLVAAVDVPGFSVAVDVKDDRIYVAGCTVLSVLDATDVEMPELLGSYWVPHGHAKDIAVQDDQIYVAGGEALFGYDAVDATSVLWTGYYAEPLTPGFYVNALVVKDNVIYIAAGDESVRSISAEKLADAAGFPALKVEDESNPPTLGGPETLPDPSVVEEPVQQDIVLGDPIGIGLRDDLLLVLGNFRWMGERTLFLFDVTPAGMMTEQTPYIQPNDWIGVTETDSALVLLADSGVNRAVPIQGGAISEFNTPSPVVHAEYLSDMLLLLTESGKVWRWYPGNNTTDEIVPHLSGDLGYEDLAGTDTRLYLSHRDFNSILTVTLPSTQSLGETYSEAGFLGWSRLAARPGHLYAYDWQLGRLHTFAETPTGLAEAHAQHVGYCEHYDIADYFAGNSESRSRLQLTADNQLLLLCPRNPEGNATVHRYQVTTPDEPGWISTEPLPAGRFVAFGQLGNAIITLRFDNDRYLSTITRSQAGVHQATTFTGVGKGMLIRAGVAYVADGEGTLRAFDLTGGGAPVEITPPDIQ